MSNVTPFPKGKLQANYATESDTRCAVIGLTAIFATLEQIVTFGALNGRVPADEQKEIVHGLISAGEQLGREVGSRF